MVISISFERIATLPLSLSSSPAIKTSHIFSGAFHWIYGHRQKIRPLKKSSQYKHFYWILISLHIFISFVHCDDDLRSSSIQSIPQKRGGGK